MRFLYKKLKGEEGKEGKSSTTFLLTKFTLEHTLNTMGREKQDREDAWCLDEASQAQAPCCFLYLLHSSNSSQRISSFPYGSGAGACLGWLDGWIDGWHSCPWETHTFQGQRCPQLMGTDTLG